MTQGNTFRLRISGVCGMLTPIIAFVCILLAIASYPRFSWTENALSDLGVVDGITATLFNSGLLISGVLALIFAFGLPILLRRKALGAMGALAFVLTAIALMAIGVFPENVKPTHYYVSVAFFAMSIISMIIVGAIFLSASEVKMGLFALLMAAFSATAWIIYFTTHFVEGVAIPEVISALSVSVLSMILGFKMFKAHQIKISSLSHQGKSANSKRKKI